MIRNGWRVLSHFFLAGIFLVLVQSSGFCAALSFQNDTFAFQNATVLKYKNGLPTLQRKLASDPANQYTRRCFVMSRSVVQFRKFARFEPRGAALDDKQLARRIRAIARHRPWVPALPEDQRVVFPGYANLREMSKARREVFPRRLDARRTGNVTVAGDERRVGGRVVVGQSAFTHYPNQRCVVFVPKT